MVAVLDTWPLDPAHPDQPLRKVTDFRDALEPQVVGGANGLLRRPFVMRRFQEAATGGIVDPLQVYNRVDSEAEMDGVDCIPRRTCGCDRLKPFLMPDHGLFVADIITDIAPKVDLHVFRVLDDRGMGEQTTITAAIEEAITLAGDDPLIINLSLGFAPQVRWVNSLFRLRDEPPRPPDVNANEELSGVEDFYQNSSTKVCEIAESASAREDGAKAATIAELKESRLLTAENRWTGPFALLQHLLGRGLPENVLVVAASGNDSCRPGKVHDPRMPGVIDGVIAVSALKDDDSPAEYANADDLLPMPDGVGIFGGAANAATGMSTTGGMYGLFVSDRFPDGVTPNADGWAYWAGTSFATPAVTGLAACIWQELRQRTAGPVPASTIRDAIIQNLGGGGDPPRIISGFLQS